jgi:hypothetical protein
VSQGYPESCVACIILVLDGASVACPHHRDSAVSFFGGQNSLPMRLKMATERKSLPPHRGIMLPFKSRLSSETSP